MDEAFTRENVFDILIDFFGENNVDCKSGVSSILIRFPEITVSNEVDDFVLIKDLFVRLIVNRDGEWTGVFQINRSSFSYDQLVSGYMHSHVRPMTSWPIGWSDPCLGSGPIRATLASLSSNPSTELWELFCLELDKFVKTESLNGGPYIRIRNITPKRNQFEYMHCVFSESCEEIVEELFNMLIESKDLPLNYDSFIGVALPQEQFIVTVTNLFIKWYNKQSDKESIILSNWLIDCKIENGIIYKLSDDYRTSSLLDYEGRTVLTFKGEDFPLKIYDKPTPDSEDFTVKLLKPGLFNYIANYILTRINSMKYERNQERTILI